MSWSILDHGQFDTKKVHVTCVQVTVSLILDVKVPFDPNSLCVNVLIFVGVVFP